MISVCIVGSATNKVAYDHPIKSLSPISDYLPLFVLELTVITPESSFSDIMAHVLELMTATFVDIQARHLTLMASLLGHPLESDLRALYFSYSTVVH